MSGSKGRWGQLTDAHFEMIDMVVGHVSETGEIPNMAEMAARLGVTRQGVLRKMEGAAAFGIMPPRPRYAIRWFELTPMGEKLYAQRRRQKGLQEAHRGS